MAAGGIAIYIFLQLMECEFNQGSNGARKFIINIIYCNIFIIIAQSRLYCHIIIAIMVKNIL
jgi:hypothetical protein